MGQILALPFALNFSKSLMVSAARSDENICEPVLAHRGDSSKFILDCALS